MFTHVEWCIEANLTWAWGREDYTHIREFYDMQAVESIPWAVIGCQPRSGYASMHIYWPNHWPIFVCQLYVSWAAELDVIILSCVLGQWLLQLVYYNVAVKHINHYTMGTSFWYSVKLCYHMSSYLYKWILAWDLRSKLTGTSLLWWSHHNRDVPVNSELPELLRSHLKIEVRGNLAASAWTQVASGWWLP